MDLRNNPFYLKEEEILWVEETLQNMTQKEKIAQLFCVDIKEGSKAELEES